MLIDAREIPSGTAVSTDVCVIGAGAAGITIAREFINRPIRIALIESGGFEFDQQTQALYKGRSVGRRYYDLDLSRLRFFGGTTNHWTGWCKPLSPIDFEKRDWVPLSGWPLDYATLEPYYRKAQPLCGLGPFQYDARAWEADAAGNRLQIPFAGEQIATDVFQFSPPLRFGEAYREELRRTQNVVVYLNANATVLETSESGRELRSVKLSTLNGKRMSVSSKMFVIAAGGIENPRILLNSRDRFSTGIGNHSGFVGRCFMDHLEIPSGIVAFTNPLPKFNWYAGDKQDVVRASIKTTPAAQRSQRLLNWNATLHQMADAGEASEGYGAARNIGRALQSGQLPDDLWQQLMTVLKDLDEVTSYAYARLTKRKIEDSIYLVLNRLEVAPNPNSRVVLDEEKDRLGLQRVKLDWQLSELDKRTLVESQKLLGRALGESRLGRLKITASEDMAVWPAQTQGGYHHMGTTRMSADPAVGVVNRDCQVHGVQNLFVAGSSVFTTVGNANPTLTIVALAVRLADHIKGRLS